MTTSTLAVAYSSPERVRSAASNHAWPLALTTPATKLRGSPIRDDTVRLIQKEGTCSHPSCDCTASVHSTPHRAHHASQSVLLALDGGRHLVGVPLVAARYRIIAYAPGDAEAELD